MQYWPGSVLLIFFFLTVDSLLSITWPVYIRKVLVKTSPPTDNDLPTRTLSFFSNFLLDQPFFLPSSLFFHTDPTFHRWKCFLRTGHLVLRTNAQLVSNNDRTSLLIKNDLVSYHREDKNGRGGVGELAQDFGLRHVFILTAFSHFLTAWLNIALPLQDQGAKPGRKWQGSGVTNRNRFYVQCCAKRRLTLAYWPEQPNGIPFYCLSALFNVITSWWKRNLLA